MGSSAIPPYPLKYTDPSGHWPDINALDPTSWITNINDSFNEFINKLSIDISSNIEDIRRGHPSPIIAKNKDKSLSDCFNNGERKIFKDYQQINEEEFSYLVDSVYYDLEKLPRFPFDIERAVYDTPFFDGGESGNDHHVCFGQDCYHQSSVNYFAQGMYSANTGISKDLSSFISNTWNEIIYSHPASEEEIFWTEKGYDLYIKKKKEAQEKKNKIRIMEKNEDE